MLPGLSKGIDPGLLAYESGQLQQMQALCSMEACEKVSATSKQNWWSRAGVSWQLAITCCRCCITFFNYVARRQCSCSDRKVVTSTRLSRTGSVT